MGIDPKMLAKLPLFSTFTQDDLQQLAGKMTLRNLPTNYTLIHQDDASGSIYIVIEGRLRITRALADRQEIVLARLGKGRLTGIIAGIDGKPRSASVRAAEDSTVVEMEAEDYAELLTSSQPMHVRFQRMLAQEMIRMLRSANQRFTRGATLPVEEFLSPRHLDGFMDEVDE